MCAAAEVTLGLVAPLTLAVTSSTVPTSPVTTSTVSTIEEAFLSARLHQPGWGSEGGAGGRAGEGGAGRENERETAASAAVHSALLLVLPDLLRVLACAFAGAAISSVGGGGGGGGGEEGGKGQVS